MKFDSLYQNKTLVGLSTEHNDVLFFFGTRDCDEAFLKSHFSNLTFSRVQQFHSDVFVEVIESDALAGAIPREADAQWTSLSNNALLISTADCLPILISGPRFIAAVHAGWRGIKSEILVKTLNHLSDRYKFSGAELTICIGPYIHIENFEVDRELAHEFLQLYDSYFRLPLALSPELRRELVLPQVDNDQKAFVDLSALALAQLALFGTPASKITDVKINTYSSMSYASFRRDKTVGRNFSFVARRPGKV